MNLSLLPFSQSKWIWTADAGHPRFAVRRFRTEFECRETQKLHLHVSADSRYLLFLDGVLLGRGPARSDLRHYVYETYAVPLPAGRHTLAALVVAYGGDGSPISEMHDRGAFLLEAQNATGAVVCATGGDGWRVHTDTAYRPVPIPWSDGYYGIGAAERVDGGRIPHGWEQPSFDDAAWDVPVALLEPYLRERSPDLADPGGRWRLVPRDIPALREEARQFQNWPGAWEVPAGTHREIILDAGEYACGYPVLSVEGGAGATVEIVYAEALTKDGRKGVRDNRDGTDVVGFADTYQPGGGHETYSPLPWRAFRFVKLRIQTAQSALKFTDFSYILTGYPWERRAEFAVANGPAELAAVQDVDFRTLARCTAETFMDCPYYEQLQYAGDTRLQALLSYVTTGDTRLGARAVRLFDWSRLSDGLTQSRYPSRLEQTIPPFSLLWILTVEDLWRYAPGEATTVADCLPGCRGVLEWFRRHLTPDGVLGGPLPWWNFVDWAEGFPDGVPAPAAAGLPSATLNLQFLAALQAYVRLHDGLGDARESEFWQAEADMLADAILTAFWDPDAQLLREGPDDSWGRTQHAQAWGILTDVIPRDAWDAVAGSLHTDGALTRTTYYHTFYVAEALAKVGRLEELWSRCLAPWRQALDLHLTTWPEQPEPTRSDCHAWSAWPTYCFLTHVLGVRPDAPGFAAHALAPRRVAGWDRVSGSVAVPAGQLQVTVDWTEGSPKITSAVM